MNNNDVLNIMEYLTGESLPDKDKLDVTITRSILISFAHLTIGIGIIALSTYIPAELKLLQWSESSIAYLVGVATLFELSRLVIGYYGDSGLLTYKNFFGLGLLISVIGLVVIAHTIGGLIVIFGMILFTIGSAILSTIIDAYLIANSRIRNKSRIAAVTQFFRLTGFAVGGVLGIVLYQDLPFTSFFYVIAGIHFIASFITFILLQEVHKPIKEKVMEEQVNYKELFHALRDKAVIGMTLFLILYPIGLFAQDAILEPFALGVLQFEKSGVGRMAAIWGTATLIFIPLAIVVEKKIGRIITIFIGLTLASIALLMLAFLGLKQPVTATEIKSGQNILYMMLFLFGSGLGLMTTPGTAMMFDICAHNKALTTSLIAYFGVIVTVSRASAAFLSGIVLELTGNNFSLLFTLEAIILFSALFPLLYVNKLFKTIGIEVQKDIPLALSD